MAQRFDEQYKMVLFNSVISKEAVEVFKAWVSQRVKINMSTYHVSDVWRPSMLEEEEHKGDVAVIRGHMHWGLAPLETKDTSVNSTPKQESVFCAHKLARLIDSYNYNMYTTTVHVNKKKSSHKDTTQNYNLQHCKLHLLIYFLF